VRGRRTDHRDRRADRRDALQQAELAPLLPALAYLTGDMSLLRADLRPDPLMLNLPFSGYTDEQQARSASWQLAALAAYRDGGCVPAPAPTTTSCCR
jgi:hypothetical protein